MTHLLSVEAEFLSYEAEDSRTPVEVRFESETVLASDHAGRQQPPHSTANKRANACLSAFSSRHKLAQQRSECPMELVSVAPSFPLLEGSPKECGHRVLSKTEVLAARSQNPAFRGVF